ncbi:hypothetical protein CC86DRAFT_35161 [Ophiobolus disseminans]|uniref:Uncharacterized protein n=1 Tax=Ophiobolus disseminans TaxID=1469910 RepID=A0A6A6ZZE4_9PLEO|nr:hypothetical protein CC86DRAFT_35161 [Ophiobolus disseminans]
MFKALTPALDIRASKASIHPPHHDHPNARSSPQRTNFLAFATSNRQIPSSNLTLTLSTALPPNPAGRPLARKTRVASQSCIFAASTHCPTTIDSHAQQRHIAGGLIDQQTTQSHHFLASNLPSSSHSPDREHVTPCQRVPPSVARRVTCLCCLVCRGRQNARLD